MNYCNESPSYHLKKIPHQCNEDTFFSTESSKGKKRIKRYNTWTWGKTKRNAGFSEKELSIFKNVVIKCRSSGISYHKIAGAFHISSRTVHTWVSKIVAIKRTLIQVNIKAVANSLYAHLHAYRMGWIQEISTKNILAGESIH